MTIKLSPPGTPAVSLEHLLLDVNGTLSVRGVLLDGVATRVELLRDLISVRLISADTFGTMEAIAQTLRVPAVHVGEGRAKLELVNELGRDRCVVIGNGRNDALALEAAALGIAVVGPEGASTAALRVADAVCTSITDALGLLIDPRVLSATLRA
jgi:P-type E1-E2 ATPase